MGSVRLMQERCPNYGGAVGSLEDAFPPRNGSRSALSVGDLEDAFPPRNGSRPALGMGSLEDAFPPQRGHNGIGGLEDAFPPQRSSRTGCLEDAFPPRGLALEDAPPRLPSGGRRGPAPK